jgi:hypothetical protein
MVLSAVRRREGCLVGKEMLETRTGLLDHKGVSIWIREELDTRGYVDLVERTTGFVVSYMRLAR